MKSKHSSINLFFIFNDFSKKRKGNISQITKQNYINKFISKKCLSNVDIRNHFFSSELTKNTEICVTPLTKIPKRDFITQGGGQ